MSNYAEEDNVSESKIELCGELVIDVFGDAEKERKMLVKMGEGSTVNMSNACIKIFQKL